MEQSPAVEESDEEVENINVKIEPRDILPSSDDSNEKYEEAILGDFDYDSDHESYSSEFAQDQENYLRDESNEGTPEGESGDQEEPYDESNDGFDRVEMAEEESRESSDMQPLRKSTHIKRSKTLKSKAKSKTKIPRVPQWERPGPKSSKLKFKLKSRAKDDDQTSKERKRKLERARIAKLATENPELYEEMRRRRRESESLRLARLKEENEEVYEERKRRKRELEKLRRQQKGGKKTLVKDNPKLSEEQMERRRRADCIRRAKQREAEEFDEEKKQRRRELDMLRKRRKRAQKILDKANGIDPGPKGPSKKSNWVNYPSFQFACSICTQKFQLEISRDKHYEDHLANLTCRSCPRSFDTPEELTEHMGDCVFWLQTLYARLSQPDPNAEDPSRPFSCIHPSCGKGFADRNALRRHMNGTHASERPFPCELCEMSFKRKDDLRVHIKGTHEGARRKGPPREKVAESNTTMCELCGKIMKNPVSLRRHMKTHVEERNFICEFCSSTFKCEVDLQRHINRIHVNIRKYHCEVEGCGKSFHTKAELGFHSHVHSKLPKKFQCEFCPKSYDFQRKLDQHLKIKHLGMPIYSCDFCDKKFNYVVRLKKHICPAVLVIFPELLEDVNDEEDESPIDQKNAWQIIENVAKGEGQIPGNSDDMEVEEDEPSTSLLGKVNQGQHFAENFNLTQL